MVNKLAISTQSRMQKEISALHWYYEQDNEENVLLDYISSFIFVYGTLKYTAIYNNDCLVCK